MSGFDANAGELVAAASSIRSLADPIRDEHSKNVADLGLGQGDFGRVHGQHFSGFQEGMTKLSKCISSMADAMDDFAKKLEDTGKGYDWSDADAESTLDKSGSN